MRLATATPEWPFSLRVVGDADEKLEVGRPEEVEGGGGVPFVGEAQLVSVAVGVAAEVVPFDRGQEAAAGKVDGRGLGGRREPRRGRRRAFQTAEVGEAGQRAAGVVVVAHLAQLEVAHLELELLPGQRGVEEPKAAGGRPAVEDLDRHLDAFGVSAAK